MRSLFSQLKNLRRITWVLMAVASVCFFGLWFITTPNDLSNSDIAHDRATAALELTRSRTAYESRTNDFVIPFEVTAKIDSLKSNTSDAPPNAELDAGFENFPEGYSLGTFHGPMKRAPMLNRRDQRPSPNPDWLQINDALDEALNRARLDGRESVFAVARLRPTADLQTLGELFAARGVTVEGMSGEYARIRVPADLDVFDSLLNLDGVMGVGTVASDLKASASFVEQSITRAPSESIPVFITLFADDDHGEWRSALSDLGVTVGAYDNDVRSYVANLTPSVLLDVIAADFVLAIEPIVTVTPSHATSIPAMGADHFRRFVPARDEFFGTVGRGITVGVLDTGLNTNHHDISFGRDSICGANLVNDENWDLWLDLNGHGTHVFGTIAGAGRIDPVLAGIAPRVSHLRFGKVLSAYGFGSSDDIRRGMDYLASESDCLWRGERSVAVQPRIVNMSLSARSLHFSGRGVGERKLDSVVRSHSQLYVVAQANAGVHGFSNYGTAKNSLAVGAVNDAGIIAGFSSHGPTADGRVKPNVVGTGVALTSAKGGGSISGHWSISGTSMASPSVAGIAALLMQASPEYRYDPALARARLMASAIRPQIFLSSPVQLPHDNTNGPGKFQNQYGMGLVSARTSLLSKDDPEGWIIGSAKSNPDEGVYEFIDIEVPDDASRLDVVLTWDEQPTDTLTQSVINDLDLWVDVEADCADEECGEYSSRSRIDNVEWLFIENPTGGTYRIKVVPVTIYGESSSAAVAWKIIRGSSTPKLELSVEDSSDSDNSEYVTLDISVGIDGYVASGTTIHISCIASQSCDSLRTSYRPTRNIVYRNDRLNWRPNVFQRAYAGAAIPIGELTDDSPGRVQISFLRDDVPADSQLYITASSWNAMAAGQRFVIRSDTDEVTPSFTASSNDDFNDYESLQGVSGETRLSFASASREPGEEVTLAASRTLWYAWRAPTNGLYRFRLQSEASQQPWLDAFSIYEGDSLIDLELLAEKSGSEITFNATEEISYKLRIHSYSFNSPPLMLKWESADSRPPNDDLAYAQLIEGENGSLDATNEGATIEDSEFLGGVAASVWYEWVAPKDGWWRFWLSQWNLRVYIVDGERASDLRLLSAPTSLGNTATFLAREGRTYRIGVSSRTAQDSGSTFSLSWSLQHEGFVPTVASDLFENAIELNESEGVFRFPWKFQDLTVEPEEPSSTGIGTSWWRWTVPRENRYTWKMNGSSSYELNFYIGDGISDLRQIGSLHGGSTSILDVDEASQIWIAFGRSAADVGLGGVEPKWFSWGPSPANDNRATAISIDGASGSVSTELKHATTEANEPVDIVGTDSVWWRWKAPRTEWYRFWIEGHPDSRIVAIYPDATSDHSVANSERSFLVNGRVEFEVIATSGTEYDLRIALRPGTSNDESSTVHWRSVDAPAYLSYSGSVVFDAFATNPQMRQLRRPRHVAITKDGSRVFATSDRNIVGFSRDRVSGELDIAVRVRQSDGSGTLTADNLQYAEYAYLWWNDPRERLFAFFRPTSYSFRLNANDSSLLSHEMVSLSPLSNNSQRTVPGATSTDGRHLYTITRSFDAIRTYQVESDAELVLSQVTVSEGTRDEQKLVVPGLVDLRDVELTNDGRFLYAATQNDIFVFSRDETTGKLDVVGEPLRGNRADGTFFDIRSIRNIAMHPNEPILFVAGSQLRSGAFLEAAVAAFDISLNPAEPNHLDTIFSVFFESSAFASTIWTHLRPYSNPFRFCQHLVPHVDRIAVDVFCSSGFYVANWNENDERLEVTDFALAGEDDRFGNRLPYALGNVSESWLERRQMVQSPDGSHVYRTTSTELGAYVDAIHVFERAHAMQAKTAK